MIDPDVCNAIYQLHLAGTPLHEISRQFQLSRNTVRAIIRRQGRLPQTERKDKIHVRRRPAAATVPGMRRPAAAGA